MKYSFLIITFIFFGCSSKKSKDNEQMPKIEEIAHIEKTQVVNEDTISFKYFLRLSNENVQIPDYLIDSFIFNNYSNSEMAFYCDYYGNDHDKYFKIAGNFIVPLSVNCQFASEKNLVSFNAYGQIIDQLIVEYYTDSGVSENYSYVYFKIYNDTLIEKVEVFHYYYKKSDNDKSDQAITEKTNSVYEYYVITNTGYFDKVKNNNGHNYRHLNCIASVKILDDIELDTLSKYDLRILRNELFARNGYIFNSDDLNSYFKKFDWYDPRFENVEDVSLTPVEKYNINQIKLREENFNH